MSTGSTRNSDGSLNYSIESINHFLNRFEYPFRGLIYQALLNYASFEVLSGQNTSLEPFLQCIASYDSEGTVSADEVEQALKNAVAAFPFSLEGAKETVLSFLRQVASTHMELYGEVVGIFYSFLPSPPLLDRLRHDLAWTDDQFYEIMDASILIRHFEPSWLCLLFDQSIILPVEASELEANRDALEGETAETVEAGSSDSEHSPLMVFDEANGSSDVSSVTPASFGSHEANSF